MRISFDKFYPYAAHLNTLIQDKVFLSAKFSDLSESIKAYYDKAHDNMENLKKIIKIYQTILSKYNKKLVLKRKLETNSEINKIKLSSNSTKNNNLSQQINTPSTNSTISEDEDKLMESQSIIFE